MPRSEWGRIYLAVCLCVFIVCSSCNVFAATVIYYKKDKDGVIHVTNRRGIAKSQGFRVYLVFRDILRRLPRADKGKVIKLAKKYARQFGMDESLIQAVIEVESGYDSTAVSSKGAEGLMQIMPATQQDLGVTNSFDADQNVRAGVSYLCQMYKRFGSVSLALAAYNAGPGNVEKHNGIPPYTETRQYVKKVLARYNSLKK